MIDHAVQVQKEGRTMVKGIRYPMFDLEDAVNVASHVNKLGGGQIDIEVLAEGLNHSLSTARQHIASAKYFNLIERKNNTITNTDLANHICMPISNDEKIQNLQKAFLKFSIFAALHERFKGSIIIPNESILSNLLHREFGISVTGKNVLAKNFMTSSQFSKFAHETTDGNLKIACEDTENDLNIEKEEYTKIKDTVINQNISEIDNEKVIDEIIDFEYELETYKSKGLLLQVDPNNNPAIKKGISFLQMLLNEEVD